jgi:hypothetical protein
MRGRPPGLCRKKRPDCTAPVVHGLQRRFRLTHPFHPRTGESFSLIGYRRSWGQESVDGLDAEGKPFSAPLSWTDAGTEDLFLTVSEGRAYGHVTQLLRLAELVEEVGP